MRFLLFPLLFWTIVARVALGSTFAEDGLQPREVTVCFVAPALSERPDRAKEILTILKQFENVTAVTFRYLGECPASVTKANGDDSYSGRLRIMLSGTAALNKLWNATPVPGKGCTKKNPASSWSAFPVEADAMESCLYNLKLGDDGDVNGPYLNHPLHEFGHFLGLAHEHDRADVPKNDCDIGGALKQGYLTSYDPRSVMHYQFLRCGVDGNYGRSGFSPKDVLGLRILYPTFNGGMAMPAEVVGTTVLAPVRTLNLSSGWREAGVNMEGFTKNHVWTFNGVEFSRAPWVEVRRSLQGTFEVSYSYSDRFDRKYFSKFRVRYLSAEEFETNIVGPVPASLPLM